MKNPIKSLLFRYRYKKYAKKWNSDVDYISSQINKDSDLFFKWDQLVRQEIKMFINIGK